MKLRQTILVASFLLCGGTLVAQVPETFLVPIHSPLPTPGAFGSQWVSELYIHNAGEEAVAIENIGPPCQIDPCPAPVLPPKVTLPVLVIRDVIADDAVPGALIYAEAGKSDLLRFQLRVRDTSRSAFGWGTWLPVVRESTAPAGTIDLLSVPVEPGYRQMLRVYSFGELGRVQVRVFGIRTDTLTNEPDPLLAEFSLDLIRFTSSDPGYAEFAAFNDLGIAVPLIRIEIAPQNGSKVWGMISLTNNVTQEVTGIFPN